MEGDSSTDPGSAVDRVYGPEVIQQRDLRRAQLLQNVKARKDGIWTLLSEFEGAEADLVYRFYHQSAKVFQYQALIRAAFVELNALAPDGTELNDMFARIILDASSKVFVPESTNPNWPRETRPLLEAFFHCKHLLNSLFTFTYLEDLPQQHLPEYVGTVFELYFLR